MSQSRRSVQDPWMCRFLKRCRNISVQILLGAFLELFRILCGGCYSLLLFIVSIKGQNKTSCLLARLDGYSAPQSCFFLWVNITEPTIPSCNRYMFLRNCTFGLLIWDWMFSHTPFPLQSGKLVRRVNICSYTVPRMKST